MLVNINSTVCPSTNYLAKPRQTVLNKLFRDIFLRRLPHQINTKKYRINEKSSPAEHNSSRWNLTHQHRNTKISCSQLCSNEFNLFHTPPNPLHLKSSPRLGKEPVQGQTITTSDLRVSVSHSPGDLGSISLDTDPVYIIPTCAGEALTVGFV